MDKHVTHMALIAWKNIRGKLVKLEIPQDAVCVIESSHIGKCNKAKVLAITDKNGENPINEIVNTTFLPHIAYRVGEMVYPDCYDNLAHGIHFFIDKQDAIDY